MSRSSLLLLLGFTVTCSALLTGRLRAYAMAHRVLDVPNARSSHQVPTPRGGGVAIVVSFLIGLAVLWASGDIPASTTIALTGASAIVAVVGFVDDHLSIAARWRFLAHFCAAAWVLYWIGAPPLDWPGGAVDLGILGLVLGTLYLVWMLNLHNFMDGIDGIAGIEATTVTIAGGLLSWLIVGPLSAVAAPALLLAAAAVGFLVWNLPPAKIFMGDAGSGFLGVLIGSLSLLAGWESPALFWSWVILAGVFIVDATLTLLRRLVRRQRVYEAHRSHAYQIASRHLGAHRPVSLAVGLINLVWLCPIAAIVACGVISGIAGVTIAYAPLVGLAAYFKAGSAEPQSG